MHVIIEKEIKNKWAECFRLSLHKSIQMEPAFGLACSNPEIQDANGQRSQITIMQSGRQGTKWTRQMTHNW